MRLTFVAGNWFFLTAAPLRGYSHGLSSATARVATNVDFVGFYDFWCLNVTCVYSVTWSYPFWIVLMSEELVKFLDSGVT